MGPACYGLFRLIGVCCQLPLFDDGQAPAEPACTAGAAGVWASFAGGVALLALSVWSAAWLAIKLLH